MGCSGRRRCAASGQLDLISMDGLNFKKPTADALFASVASSFGARAIAAVLSGHLSDGAAGSRIIKQLGGIVLVQDPATAGPIELSGSTESTHPVAIAADGIRAASALAGLVQIAQQFSASAPELRVSPSLHV